jgi:hypothetical protein
MSQVPPTPRVVCLCHKWKVFSGVVVVTYPTAAVSDNSMRTAAHKQDAR